LAIQSPHCLMSCLYVCVTEQYIQSIEDFKSSLEVLKTTVDDVKTDRSVAETHYHIGVACVYACCYDDGVTHFREAISILEAKNAALQGVVSAADVKEGSEESDEVTAARSEMKEIAELIPDIRLKVFYCTCSMLKAYTMIVQSHFLWNNSGKSESIETKFY